MKLTVTVITKNEADNIERCLASAPFADEIVVVDSGSDDGTVEIARRFTDRVVINAWPGHVAQKQHAVDLAEHDWILSLDADEEVSDELAAQIEALKAAGPEREAYTVRRRTFYLGQWINHSGWYPDTRIRLFDRRRARWGGTNPHDEVICDGSVGELAGDVNHYSYRDMSHHLSRINEYTTIMAAESFAKGRRAGLVDLLLRPPFAFVKKYVLQKGFLDGRHGLVVCALTGYYVFCKYAKLWERGLAEPKK
jgi:glycosyltransferase involved in cell wall biosynthesis